MEWIRDLAVNFRKTGDLVQNDCAGTLATAKECLLLREHHLFVVYEKNAACFQNVLPSLVQVYAKHVLSPDSDKTGSGEVVEAGRLFVADMTAFISKGKTDSWMATLGLAPVQTIPVQIIHFLGNVYKDARILEKCRPKPL